MPFEPITLADLPTLDLSRIPSLATGPTVAQVEADMDRLPHLDGDRRLTLKAQRLELRDARRCGGATATLGTIPRPDEQHHLIVSGKFALCDLVPAVLELAGCRIEALTIATLGFSRENVSLLCGLLDAGRIGYLRLLSSHYFKGTSTSIYDYALAEIRARPSVAEMLSLRTHAKLLLMSLADGRRLTVESSANLRSCKNIEQATVYGHPDLYAFHHAWIEGLFHARQKANP